MVPTDHDFSCLTYSIVENTEIGQTTFESQTSKLPTVTDGIITIDGTTLEEGIYDFVITFTDPSDDKTGDVEFYFEVVPVSSCPKVNPCSSQNESWDYSAVNPFVLDPFPACDG